MKEQERGRTSYYHESIVRGELLSLYFGDDGDIGGEVGEASDGSVNLSPQSSLVLPLFRCFCLRPRPLSRPRLGAYLQMVLGQNKEIESKTDDCGCSRRQMSPMARPLGVHAGPVEIQMPHLLYFVKN